MAILAGLVGRIGENARGTFGGGEKSAPSPLLSILLI